MKRSKTAAPSSKLRVNAQTMLHLRSVHDLDLPWVRGGGMTTYDDCYTGVGCHEPPQAQ